MLRFVITETTNKRKRQSVTDKDINENEKIIPDMLKYSSA